MTDREQNRDKPRVKNLLKVVIPVIISTVFFGMGLGVGLFKYFHSELPSIAKMELDPPNLVTRILAADSTQLAELYTERRIPVPLSQIPPDLKMALLSVEDRKFYTHWGLDIWSILRAFYANWRYGKITQGGSTITQQLARELFLTREKTYSRKIREAILAWEIETTYTKNEILERYFNQIYFGSGAWGIEEAALTYFGKSVSELDLSECAMLAGLPNAPNRNSPLNNMSNALERRNWVLTCMVETECIDSHTADSLKALPIKIDPRKHRAWLAPYFVEYVTQQLLEDFSEEDLYRRGLQVYTTLDVGLQAAAEKHLEEHLQMIESGNPYRFDHLTRAEIIGENPLNVPELRNTNYLQGALLALEPRQGHIKAMVGGRNYLESKFNRVSQALRQPGSAFKPFVYTAAIDNGIPACQVVEDSPITIIQANGIPWRPSNYTGEFRGPVTIRTGFALSINLVAIKTLMTVGAETVGAYARRMGISTAIPAVESIAVGSADVYPIELITAYTVFPNLGVKVEPMAITEVRDSEGNLVKRYRPSREEVLSTQTAYLVLNMMQDVIDVGTGVGVRSRGFTNPAGGKTGTTNNYTDAWFVGYTTDMVCGVWVGFDQPRRIVNRGTGSALALPIWTEFMKEAHADLEPRDFEKPTNGLTTRLVCKSSGLPATQFCPMETVYTEIFKVGTEPGEHEECFIHKPSIYMR